jgi:hypothetical protein
VENARWKVFKVRDFRFGKFKSGGKMMKIFRREKNYVEKWVQSNLDIVRTLI